MPEIYCSLNPRANSPIGSYSKNTICGINLTMDPTKYIREPDVILFFKGELYNHQMLCESMNLSPIDTSAESIIIRLYKLYGIDYTLQVLEGVFIFILFDYDYRCDVSKLYMVRDPFGIIPFFGQSYNNMFTFSDTLTSSEYSDCTVNTGTYALYVLPMKVCTEWVFAGQTSYYTVPNSRILDITPFRIENSQTINAGTGVLNEKMCKDGDCVALVTYWRTQLTECLKTIIQKYMDKDTDKYLSLLSQKHDMILHGKAATKLSAKTWIHIDDFTDINTMFEYDICIRNQLHGATFELDTVYPFFNTDFVGLYFSIPLNLRYMYHTEIFGG